MFQQSLIASYSYPIKQQAIESFFAEFLLNGVIERVADAKPFTILPSCNPNGSWRLNLDVSALNKLLHIKIKQCFSSALEARSLESSSTTASTKEYL